MTVFWSISAPFRCTNIVKTFGSVIASNGVCLSINSGEILSLLGENGSGKTTLMNMLSGIYFPDDGQILINGKRSLNPLSARRLTHWGSA